jgi:two-component system sensor histidine kinase UhpB
MGKNVHFECEFDLDNIKQSNSFSSSKHGTVNLHLSVYPVREKKNEAITGFLILMNNISVVKHLETVIRQKEEVVASFQGQVFTMFNELSDSVYITDLETHTILLSNPSLNHRLGKNPIGRKCYDELYHLQQPCIDCEQQIPAPDQNDRRYRIRRDMRTQKIYLSFNMPFQLPDHKHTRLEISSDITEFRLAKEHQRQWSEMFNKSNLGIAMTTPEGLYEKVNFAFAKMHGYTIAELNNQPAEHVLMSSLPAQPNNQPADIQSLLYSLFTSWHVRKDGSSFPVLEYSTELIAEGDQPQRRILYAIDMTHCHRLGEELQKALNDSHRIEREASALLKISNTALQNAELAETIQTVFDACKEIIGTSEVYLAMVSPREKDGKFLIFKPKANSPLFKDAVPAPNDGLLRRCYTSGQVVVQNDFEKSEYATYHTQFHISIQNILCAPVIVNGETLCIISLLNKPNGFCENDEILAAGMGEIVSAAFRNSRSAEALKNSSDRFQTVAQATTDAIIIIDTKGKIIFWNKAAENIFDYSAKEMIGQTLEKIMSERYYQEHTKGLRRLLSTYERRYIGKTVEMIGRRRNGSQCPIEISLVEWKSSDNPLFVGIIHDTTERKVIQEVLDRHQSQLQRIAEKMENIRERERKHISRELQKGAAQQLENLKSKLKVLEAPLRKEKDTYEQLLLAQNLIDSIIESVKQVGVELRPRILEEHGLPEAIKWFAKRFQEETKIFCKVSISSESFQGAEELDTAVFRIFQEALDNIRKHSRATEIEVKLDVFESLLKLSVKDNGIGIKEEALHKPKSVGFMNMNEHAGAFSGVLDIANVDPHGVIVTASFSIKQR